VLLAQYAARQGATCCYSVTGVRSVLPQAENHISAFMAILTGAASFGGRSKKGSEGCTDLHLLTRTWFRASEQAEQLLQRLHRKLFLI